MNDGYAVGSGSLAGRLQFFGAAQAEIVSYDKGNTGSWNVDYALTVYSERSWSRFGGQSPNGTDAGEFSFSRFTGGYDTAMGHRTILSGY